MGSSVSNAAKSVTDQAKSVVDKGTAVVQGVRKRPLENGVNLALLGVPSMVRTGGTVAAGAAGLLPDGTPADIPAMDATAPSLVDPVSKRKRMLDGRAGTILTGGGDSSSLGSSAGRSNLLGL